MPIDEKLGDLIEKLPEEIKPWVITYGPIFLKMTQEELKAWIDYILKGDLFAAYSALVEALPAEGLMNEWDKIKGEWTAANIKNVEKMDLQKSAIVGFLKIMLMVALAAVGL